MSATDPAVRAQFVEEIRTAIVVHPSHDRESVWSDLYDQDDLLEQLLKAIGLDWDDLREGPHEDCRTCGTGTRERDA